jgi:hypothetical protein
MNSKRLFTFFCFLLCGALCGAQQNSAELSGRIVDASGALIPGADVTVVQPSTGLMRTTRTNGAGLYTVTQLPPGTYTLTISHTGFQTEVRSNLELTVGQQATLKTTMQVGAITTQTIVSSDLTPVETQSSALSGIMDKRSIRELPLNGRDVVQLALLEPGVAPSRRTSDSAGSGKQLSIGGKRPDQISFVLDGSDINDANNNTPGSVSGVLLGVDTLQEFRVLTSSYSAEYGRSAGGVIDAITRSGSNSFHGSLFEFVRNSQFDAKNYFDPPNQSIPPFKRNQFGGVVDGPVAKDNTFFLFSYEGFRQRLGVTNVAVVPDAAARQGDIPGQAHISVNPAVPGYLNLIPLPNGPDFGDGTGQYISSASNSTGENFLTARIDHHFSDKTSLFARYSYDAGAVSVPDRLLLNSSDTSSRNQYSTIQTTHVFSDHLLNDLRISYNRSHSDQVYDYLRPVSPALSFFPGAPLGQISITGLFSLGPSRFGPSFSTQNLFQAGDDLSWTVGRHSLKIGASEEDILFPTSRPQSPYGFYQFNSLSDFLRASPYAVEITLPNSKLVRNWHQSLTAAYVQDDFRAFRNFTLNIGFRYERTSVPTERDGLVANLRNPLHDTAPTVGQLYANPSNLNFAPRFGFAWDPFGDGKTSIRSGFGLFFDPLWTDFYANAANREPPFYTLGSVQKPVFPDASIVAGSPAFVLGRLDALMDHPANPYSMQYNFTIQREIVKGGALTVAYVGSRGVHEVRLIDQNQAIPEILPDGRKFFPANSKPRNPNFTGIRYKVTDGQSSYNGLQAAFAYQLNRYLALHTSYTYSKAIDDGSIVTTQGGDNDLPQDPDNRKAERGLSNYDLRHYFVSYLSGNLPKLPGPRWIASGWQINAISTLASGNPFSVVVGYDRARARFQAGTAPERPNLIPGYSANPVLGSPTQYFDPSAFSLPAPGFYGDLGRNTLVGPGLANLDVSVNKMFYLTERINLQFRTELFNTLNHPNFAIPSQRTVFSSSGRVRSAGLITSTLTSSRQLQLGLKLSF